MKLKLGNACANVYTEGKDTRAILIPSRHEAGKFLIEFTDDFGIPKELITDGASEFMGGHHEFFKQAHRMHIKLHATESGRKNQNYTAECR